MYYNNRCINFISIALELLAYSKQKLKSLLMKINALSKTANNKSLCA